MTSSHIRRAAALLVSAMLLASISVATAASPASAAKPKCQGKTATIVGTKKGEVIRGTAKRDIIVARGGHDHIYGRGGNDIICAGGGNDTVYGGRGIDRLWGQLGHDRLIGNAGPDFLAGQVGNDTLVGGIGVDTCFQGTGSGPVSTCERPAAPAPAPPPEPGVLAIAYTDIDGVDGYGPSDVLIARLTDTTLDGIAGPGDTIEMGRYPLDRAVSGFGDWRVKSHPVSDVFTGNPVWVWVGTQTGRFSWRLPTERLPYSESFAEGAPGAGESSFVDGFGGNYGDRVAADVDSPSRPTTSVSDIANDQYTSGDQPFVDVEIHHPTVLPHRPPD